MLAPHPAHDLFRLAQQFRLEGPGISHVLIEGLLVADGLVRAFRGHLPVVLAARQRQVVTPPMPEQGAKDFRVSYTLHYQGTPTITQFCATEVTEETFRKDITEKCARANIDYVPLDTSMQFDKALIEYLHSRRSRF